MYTYRYALILVVIASMSLAIPLNALDLAFASSGRDLTEEERESGLYNEKGYVRSQSQRAAINPDFAPD